MSLVDAIRTALKDSGAPLTLDDLMEQLPDTAERNVVGAACRQLKDRGEVVTSVEDGRLAYSWASTAPPRAKLIGRIRELLRSASEPLTTAQVCAALPDANESSVQSMLSQRARAGEFTASRTGRKFAYSLADRGGVSVAVNVRNVTTSAPAAPPPAQPQPPAPPAAPATPKSPRPPATSEQADALDYAVQMAEAARETYVLSKVDADVYTWLQASVHAARAARDAFKATAT
ncbi:hypothetical protein ACVCL0_09195 [Rhodanobacter sp. UC4450_H17]